MYNTVQSIVIIIMKTADSKLLAAYSYIHYVIKIIWRPGLMCKFLFIRGNFSMLHSQRTLQTMKGFSSGNKKHLGGHMQQQIQWHATLTLISPRLKALPQSFRLNQKDFHSHTLLFYNKSLYSIKGICVSVFEFSVRFWGICKFFSWTLVTHAIRLVHHLDYPWPCHCCTVLQLQ